MPATALAVIAPPRSPRAAVRRHRRAGARPTRTTTDPSTITVSTSAAVAARTACAGSTPAVRTLSSRTATTSARAPAARRPASGQPSEACPVSVGEQFAGSEPPALQRRRTLVAFEQLRLAQQIDHDVLIAAERDRHPTVAQRGRRCDAVGQIVLGGRADAHGRARRRRAESTSAASRCTPCTAVVAGPSTPSSASKPRRCHAVRGETRVVLGRLLRQMDVQRPAVRHRGNLGQGRTRHRPHRMGRDAVAQRRAHPAACSRARPTGSTSPSLNRSCTSSSGSPPRPPVR